MIRDEAGAVLKAGIGREDHLQDAFHAELLSCETRLKVAAAMGIAAIIMETDAAMVKEALEGDEYRLSAMGGIYLSLISSNRLSLTLQASVLGMFLGHVIA